MKQLDRYSMMIIAKYFKTKEDYRNIMQVNSKFKNLNDMYLFNPISISSISFFPNIQTYYLYSKYDRNEIFMRKVKLKYVNYPVSYKEYLDYKRFYSDISFSKIYYSQNDSYSHGKQIKEVVNILSDNSFEHYSLKSISFPPSIHSIGRECFSNSYSLISVYLPSSISSLKSYCFSYNTQLTSVTLCCSISSLPSYCFYHCHQLQSITFKEYGKEIESFEESCFSHCSSLKSIILPSSVTYLGNNCFEHCSCLKIISIWYQSPLLDLSFEKGSNSFQFSFDSCNSLTIVTRLY